jgi:hypothetical protein
MVDPFDWSSSRFWLQIICQTRQLKIPYIENPMIRINSILLTASLSMSAFLFSTSGCASSGSGEIPSPPVVGQTKQQVQLVWGQPERTRQNSDGTSAELFVPDKWKFAAPFYGMAAHVHALVVKFDKDNRVTSWQMNDQNMFSGEASLQ